MEILAFERQPGVRLQPEPARCFEVGHARLRVRKLDPNDLPEVERHLLALGPSDRRARFLGDPTDTVVAKHARGLDPNRSVLIGAFDARGCMVGLAEAHPADPPRAVEVAVSVDSTFRRRGLGQHLVSQALAVAFAHGAQSAEFVFAPGNRALTCLVLTLGGRITDPGHALIERSLSFVKCNMTFEQEHHMRIVAELEQTISNAPFDRELMQRVTAVRKLVRGRIIFASSFGIEDQAITHAIFAQALEIDVATLDTGRLFPETYQLWMQTERRYGRRISAFYPDHTDIESLVDRQGIDGFYSSVEARRACCAVRKVDPLRRALAGASAWIAGLRADQSGERAGISFAAADPVHQLIKISPLFDWSRGEVLSFVREHCVPYNSLHDRGFASIGCAPCTRAIAPGEPERAGRWWWEREQKKECGLHR
jgi:phosphoadenosine phosphosulfate reductase